MTMLPENLCHICKTYWYNSEYRACPKCNDEKSVKIYYPPITLKELKRYREEYKECIIKYKKKIEEELENIKRITIKINNMEKKI